MAGMSGAPPGYYWDQNTYSYKPNAPGGATTTQTRTNPTLPGGAGVEEASLPTHDELAGYDQSRLDAGLKSGLQTQAATEASASLNQRAKLQADAEARRLAAMSSSFSAGSQDILPRVGGSNIASDETSARQAAFGRAKDQAGQIARAALQGVQENVAGRGVAGGGIEALKTAGVIQDAAAPLQDLTREQYIQDLNRSSDISDQTYQGDIQQRGQDVTQKNANRASLLALINNAFAPALY